MLQVTWIGYPNSTGLRAVDYRFTDAICDPEDTAQTFTGVCAITVTVLVQVRCGFRWRRVPGLRAERLGVVWALEV